MNGSIKQMAAELMAKMTPLPEVEEQSERVVSEQCGNCRFYKHYPDDDYTGSYSECRRYPPHPKHDRFPSPADYEWCGEWQQEKSDE